MRELGFTCVRRFQMELRAALGCFAIFGSFFKRLVFAAECPHPIRVTRFFGGRDSTQ
jgi:hypothetical protein